MDVYAPDSGHTRQKIFVKVAYGLAVPQRPNNQVFLSWRKGSLAQIQLLFKV